MNGMHDEWYYEWPCGMHVMAAPVISTSSVPSEENVGSHVPRVILFGDILAVIPVIPVVPAEVPIVPADPLVVPEVGAVSVTSPVELPLVSPFLCSDDSKADSESEPAEYRLKRHESLVVHDDMVLRWRDMVKFRPSSSSGSSSHDIFAPSSEFPVAPIVAPPGILRHEAFSHWRSAPLSTPYPPTTLESSPYSFSKRSLDSSLLSDGPSHKRCRSPTTLVPSSTLVSRLIDPTLADLLPHRKRFRDSYSPEDSREEHIEIGTTNAETVADLGSGDGVGVDTDDGICMRVEIAASNIKEDGEEFEVEASAGGTMEIAVGPLVTGGISESTRGDAPDLEGTLYDIVHYMLEVPLDRITEFETA
ncbi:hypothetical protein Tco_0434686 [Tanacetum coccineum]